MLFRTTMMTRKQIEFLNLDSQFRLAVFKLDPDQTSTMTSMMRMKAANEARLHDEKKLVDRKRNVLILMARYLTANGYV